LHATCRPWLSLLVLASVCLLARAQDTTKIPPPAPPPSKPLPPPPAAGAVGATVNKQPIYEMAVYRALLQVPPDKWGEARPEIIKFLIENAIVDQYLDAIKVNVEAAAVDGQLDKVKKEMDKAGVKYEEMLKKLFLTEAELRAQINASLRWEKFVEQQAPEKVLHELFDNNKDMFNGSVVHARHLLLKADAKDAKAAEAAKARLTALKAKLAEQAQQEVAKLPATADNLAKEKARVKAIEDGFAASAKEQSQCPSGKQGGDIGWFPRVGRMVEPFAKAAFALKPYEISDVVESEFGYHLILMLERKAGRDVKYEDAKEMVKDVYSDRLRDRVLTVMRPRAQIAINPAPKQ
jgi:peptidyl-prolyl cis-trans isomerase C